MAPVATFSVMGVPVPSGPPEIARPNVSVPVVSRKPVSLLLNCVLPPAPMKKSSALLFVDSATLIPPVPAFTFAFRAKPPFGELFPPPISVMLAPLHVAGTAPPQELTGAVMLTCPMPSAPPG